MRGAIVHEPRTSASGKWATRIDWYFRKPGHRNETTSVTDLDVLQGDEERDGVAGRVRIERLSASPTDGSGYDRRGGNRKSVILSSR
jgi:hypothetical protein